MTTTSSYKVRVFTSAGLLRAEFDDFIALQYRNQVNTPALSVINTNAESGYAQYLVKNNRIEIWRKIVKDGAIALPWTRDYEGKIRRSITSYKENSYRLQITCIGKLETLSRRIVAWYAATANRSRFTNLNGETIMKGMVEYNAGPGALASNGRIRDGAITNLTVEPDSMRGAAGLHWSCAWDNLLKSLQDLSKVAGGDFDVVSSGTDALDFKFFPGQLGTDRTEKVVFSVDRGNMINPVLTEDALGEETVAVVAGKGEEADRRTRVVIGVGYSSDNDIEGFTDAKNEEDTNDALDVKGAADLKKSEALNQLTFDIVQTDGSRYGIHYFLGDRVKAVFLDHTDMLKIYAAEITVDRNNAENPERIVIEVSNV